MKDIIYIFGHKIPDTDSVCSAISLAYLKNAQGFNTEPRILSPINEETKYVLNKFKVPVPQILSDVKLQIKDINYHHDFKTGLNNSVYEAFLQMQKEDLSTIPVVDNHDNFKGVFAMKDIAKKVILGNNTLLKTSYNHILKVLDGQEILKYNEEIEGIITNIDLRTTTFHEQNPLNNATVLIVGDRHSIIEEAFNKKIKLLIVTSNNEVKKEHLEIAKKNKINIIYTSKDTFETILTIGYANYIENYHYIENIKVINEGTYITDFNDIINKTRHSYYPVINNQNKCLGLIKLSDLRDYHPKKVILVDHNELSQSVEGLEEATILEVVDHHKLGTVGTMEPINFRTMTVGSTCTIVYELFKENKIKIPNDIASLLLAGLISDTLLLKSPTTTKLDEIALKELTKLTNIDPEKLAIEMFKASDIVKSKSVKDIIYTDYKTYNLDNHNITVSQITTLSSKAILKQKNSYIKFLNKEAEMHNYDVIAFIVTDIFKNGSYIIFNEKAKTILEEAFDKEIDEGTFLEGVVSRKKQVLPNIIRALK